MPAAPRSQAKHWCYTLNNPTPECLAPLESSASSYHIAAHEVGESGTPHIQGYIVFSAQTRLSALKKLLPTAHWEVSRGSPQQASDYCKKDGNFLETGSLPLDSKQATAVYWDSIWTAATTGSILDIDSKARIQHYSTIKRIQRDFSTPPVDLQSVTGVWFYGPSGTGKSHRARAEFPGSYLKPANKWWDSYQGQSSVLIDDLGIQHAPLSHHLKIWADRYAFPAEQKGSTIQIRPLVIIVTSNYTIEELFKDYPNDIEPLLRRFTVHRCLTKYNES